MSGQISTLKTPVSLRLPSDITEAVAAYAAAHNLTKTDAYEYFLRSAITSSQTSGTESTISELNSKIDVVLNLLTNQSQSMLATAQAEEKTKIIDAVASTASQFAAINKALLFGSFARDTFTDESDIDIRLELNRTKHFNLRDLSLFSKQIEQKTGRKVDVITKDKIEDAKLKAAINSEGIIVYERKE